MLLSLKNLRYNISIQLQYLHSHKLGNLSEEQEERFHQDIKIKVSKRAGR